MSSGTELAHSLFHNISGVKPTRVIVGYGSSIFMDFGCDIPYEIKTRKGLQTRYHGEWHLWIYMCAWRIDKHKKPVVGWEDTRAKIACHLIELESREFKKAEILNDAFDVKLFFGDDIELHLFSFHTAGEYNEQWLLFTPEKKVFVAGPGCTWSYDYSNKA